MSDATIRLPEDVLIGYCTNVHAGQSVREVVDNLETYAVPIRLRLGRERPLPVGLWLPASAAEGLSDPDAVAALRDDLAAMNLLPFTFNGFPYGDFHQDSVKREVYRPHWGDERRVTYTKQLVDILAGLLADDDEGSISTLPIGWPDDFPDAASLEAAAANLLAVLAHCASVE
ncbi:MAG: hypothetical protein R3336_09600, partial [Phycisphaeraceae bacterium]|nr:hypothetical protein [Phycisphaeraceae bacterium]